MIELSACPVCDGSARATRLLRRTDCGYEGNGKLPVQLVECSCEHELFSPQPSSEELAPFYRSDYHVFANRIDEESGRGPADRREAPR